MSREFKGTGTIASQTCPRSDFEVLPRALDYTSGGGPGVGQPGRALHRDCVRSPQRLPLAQLCVLQSIWQFDATVLPPLLHAETWSASMSIGRTVFQGA